MRVVIAVCAGLTAGMFPHNNVWADDNIPEQLSHCAAIEGTSERLTCYDELAGRPVTESNETTDRSALDKLGEETLPDYERDSADKIAVEAHITSCKRNSLKKLLFYFDNGHVWKQVDNRRLRYKDCDFKVVITKDGFGYKMQPVGEVRRIRISRVR